MPTSAEAALGVAERALGRVGVAHALIGGCARNAYAPPRATHDVDLALIADAAQYARIADELRAAGFTRVRETRPAPDAELPDVASFRADSGARIDLLLAHTPFERQAIARAVPADFPTLGVVVPLVRMEDLIVYLLLAARPRDLGDIDDIVRAQARAGTVLDWALVERECAVWGVAEALQGVKRG